MTKDLPKVGPTLGWKGGLFSIGNTPIKRTVIVANNVRTQKVNLMEKQVMKVVLKGTDLHNRPSLVHYGMARLWCVSLQDSSIMNLIT